MTWDKCRKVWGVFSCCRKVWGVFSCCNFKCTVQGFTSVMHRRISPGSLSHVWLMELRQGWRGGTAQDDEGRRPNRAFDSFLSSEQRGNHGLTPWPLYMTKHSATPCRVTTRKKTWRGRSFSAAGAGNLTAMSVNHISTPILHTQQGERSFLPLIISLIQSRWIRTTSPANRLWALYLEEWP